MRFQIYTAKYGIQIQLLLKLNSIELASLVAKYYSNTTLVKVK